MLGTATARDKCTAPVLRCRPGSLSLAPGVSSPSLCCQPAFLDLLGLTAPLSALQATRTWCRA